MATQDNYFSKTFGYHQENDEYVFQLKKKRNWWWMLLLFLPFLLLIRCSHDVTVKTVNADTDNPIEGMLVTLDYDSHIIWDDSLFFNNEHHHLEQISDSAGIAVFKDLKCSVYSYIFYCLSKEVITASAPCCDSVSVVKNFHFTRNIELKISEKLEDLMIKVVDRETGDALADATVVVTYKKGVKMVTDSLKTRANGLAWIKRVNECGVIDQIVASCNGYADTMKVDVPRTDLLSESDMSTMKLRPLKEKFTFFVYNVETNQPIPGATATVTLTSSRASVTHKSSTTNVDGMGVGSYTDAFVLDKIAIAASKIHFCDSTLSGDYAVQQFVKLPDDQRIIWLRPEPYVVEYQNIDSLTSLPIAGVENEITVTYPSGKSETYVEFSNSNGMFPVLAKEGATISVVSRMQPDYREKVTMVKTFGNTEIIPLVPQLIPLTFRTIDADIDSLLANCDLVINTTKSHVTKPINSGSGEFVVDGLYPSDKLTIIASQSGFQTNDTKVNNLPVMALSKSAQEARDIPLKMILPPCSGGMKMNRPKDNIDPSTISYSMGRRTGSFEFEIDAYSIPDDFVVFDGPNDTYPVLLRVTVQDKKSFTVNFTRGAVTIKAITSGEGSSWEYIPHCPY